MECLFLEDCLVFVFLEIVNSHGGLRCTLLHCFGVSAGFRDLGVFQK